jgi:hypothetical protein
MNYDAKRRRVEALTRAVDRAIDSDRRFFARHAGRSYRLRPAFPPEVGVLAVLDGRKIELPDDWLWFTAVRQFAPGVRVRAFAAMARLGGDDPPEPLCKALFDLWASTSSNRTLFDRVAALASEDRLQ